jgi:hypothetical protein
MIKDIGTCLNCQEEFSMNRSDQKFCCNKCRSQYHNAKRINSLSQVKQVDKQLHSDYKILRSVLGNDYEILLQKDWLKKSGFSFVRCTKSFFSDEERVIVYQLYDIAYKENTNDKSVIQLWKCEK